MERTEIKPAGDDDFLGTNLNEESWVPFNENEPVTDTRLPPRPDPTVGILSPEQQQQKQQQEQQEEMMRQQQEEMMRQQQYLSMMPQQPPDKGIMNSIKETPIATIAVVFGIGLALGFMFNNRRPIILNGH